MRIIGIYSDMSSVPTWYPDFKLKIMVYLAIPIRRRSHIPQNPTRRNEKKKRVEEGRRSLPVAVFLMALCDTQSGKVT